MGDVDGFKNQVIQIVSPEISALSGALVVGGHDRDRPNLIWHIPTFGVFAAEMKLSEESEIDTGKRLAAKIYDLRTIFPEYTKLRITPVVVTQSQEKIEKIGAATLLVGFDHLSIGKLNLEIDPEIEKVEEYSQFMTRLQPALAFQAVVRKPNSDDGADDRRLMRLALDLEQIEGVMREVKDVLHIKGPPGSGKTLILIARARLLSENHPDWNIQVLAYNRTLKGYLDSELGHYDNVTVTSFWEFSMLRMQTIHDSDSDPSARFEAVKRLGIKRDVDALLIDEWQDFHPAWIRYCLETLRPNKGGLVVAGDIKQALYRSLLPSSALEGRNVDVFELKKPYRSTRQILELVNQLDSNFSTDGADLAPDGQSINLVYAQSLGHQAEFVAWEIKSMVNAGYRKARNIGVIGVTWKSVRIVQKELESQGVKCLMIGGNDNENVSPQWGYVTLTTVHSAKGYEFEVVFLMDVESLPESTENKDDLSRRRLAYVGPTRAKDELYISYTKQNQFIKAMQAMPKNFVQAWTWPDDYEVEK